MRKEITPGHSLLPRFTFYCFINPENQPPPHLPTNRTKYTFVVLGILLKSNEQLVGGLERLFSSLLAEIS